MATGSSNNHSSETTQQLGLAAGGVPPPYEIVFDGGALGNPGRGYGSFAISGPGGYVATERLDFSPHGERVTNNQAEYRTLIAALERLLRDRGDRASSSHLVVRGDSLLVINQVAGRWKVKNADLAPLHRSAVSLINRFAVSDLVWHDRSHSVRILGH